MIKIQPIRFIKNICNLFIQFILLSTGYICPTAQAAQLAYENLKKHLQQHGYFPAKLAPNIWSHTTRKTKFCLCVDGFGVQYFSKEDTTHLIQAPQEIIFNSTDFTGKKFCGLDITCNYTHGYVDITMNNFVRKTLQKLQHQPTKRKQHAPHQWSIPIYGHNRQFAPPPDETTSRTKKKLHMFNEQSEVFSIMIVLSIILLLLP